MTKQTKRDDEFISQLLKDLGKKSYQVVTENLSLGTYKEERRREEKRGVVVRAGDIIKFGRVPIMIKESSFDQLKTVNNQTKLHDFFESMSLGPDVQKRNSMASNITHAQTHLGYYRDQQDSAHNLFAQQSASSIDQRSNMLGPVGDIMRVSNITRPQTQTPGLFSSGLATIKEEKTVKKAPPKEGSKKSCRVCLCEESNLKDDPIVNVC